MIGSSISLVFNNNNNKLKTYIAHAHDEMIACALHEFNCFNGLWNHYLIWMFCLKSAEISVPNLFLWAFKGPSTFTIATCYFLVNARKLKFTNKMSKGVCIVRPPTRVLHPGILRFFFFRMNKLQHSRMLSLVNETNKYRVH